MLLAGAARRRTAVAGARRLKDMQMGVEESGHAKLPPSRGSGTSTAICERESSGARGPFRVLMLARYFPPEYSGAALQALALARELRRRGHSVEFIVFGGRSGTAGPVDDFAVTRLELGHGAKHQEFALWWNLARFLVRRRRDFDILHSHGAYYTQAAVGPLARLFGMKSLVKASLSHNDLEGVHSQVVRKVHRRMLRAIDACVAISADLEQEFASAGVAQERLVRIPNGVDVERFRPATELQRAQARDGLGLPNDRPVALYLGVFDQRKNIEWLAERWLATDGFGTGGLLLAVGPTSRDIPDRDVAARLEALAGDRASSLRVLGFAPSVEAYYRAADALILPSLGEGLPNVVLEAMASGLPCAVSAVSGSLDLVQGGVTGHTFTSGDDEGLARAVRACLSVEGRHMGRAAREFVVAQYGIPAVADAYERLYANILASKSGFAPLKPRLQTLALTPRSVGAPGAFQSTHPPPLVKTHQVTFDDLHERQALSLALGELVQITHHAAVAANDLHPGDIFATDAGELEFSCVVGRRA